MNNKYRLKIIGKNINRYISYLISNKISLYDIKTYEKYIIILVDEDGYRKILDLKTSYKVEVIDKYGVVKIRSIIKKYNIFIFGLFIGLLLVFILSNIVFDISILHSKKEIRDIILNDLSEFGIEKYHFKVSYQEKEKIIKKILNKERNRIEWLEIDNVGTKYIVKVEERIKNDIKNDNTTQHIVAKKDARILQISADSGEIVVKKNDYVKKGDILISGFITKDEEIKKKVKATGKVYGEVWYQVEVEVPKVYKEVKYTNKEKKKIEIEFLNKSFLLFDFKPYKSYDLKKKVLLKSRILPIQVNYSTVRETVNIRKKYNTSDGEKELEKIARYKLNSKLGVNDEIISKKILKKIEKDSKIEVDIFFKVKEDITDTVNIDNIDIEKIGDKNGADE